MSLFSPAQSHRLINDFWHHAGLRCPADGAPILSHLFPAAEGYLLVLTCTHCAGKTQFTRFSDPQRPAFRHWTSSEIDALAASSGTGPAAPCPVCRAHIRRRALAGSILFLDCPRCGNMHQTCAPDMSLRRSA